MPGNRDATVFIGNLDERVSDRVLYEILIQAGRVVDLHIPRDKDSNRHKGIAFAEYETEEIANYAVRLFSGLVTIYNRTLKFAISGQDKAAQNLSTVNLSLKPNLQSEQLSNNEVSQFASRFSAYPPIPSYAQQEPPPPGIIQGNGSISDPNGKNYYRHRTLGTSWDNNGHSNSSRKIRNAALMAKGRLAIAAFM